MLYGSNIEEFEDLVLKENDAGDLELEPESNGDKGVRENISRFTRR